MVVDFQRSKTKENLMKAFAGESQARNRYTIAAEMAREHHMYAVSQYFSFYGRAGAGSCPALL